MSVGKPEKVENFDLHRRENITVYVDKDFPQDPPKIIIQLKVKANPPRLVASRRR